MDVALPMSQSSAVLPNCRDFGECVKVVCHEWMLCQFRVNYRVNVRQWYVMKNHDSCHCAGAGFYERNAFVSPCHWHLQFQGFRGNCLFCKSELSWQARFASLILQFWWNMLLQVWMLTLVWKSRGKSLFGSLVWCCGLLCWSCFGVLVWCVVVVLGVVCWFKCIPLSWLGTMH